MSGFYYEINLVDFQLNTAQLNKVRDYLREKVRDVAAIDSGEYLRSLKTSWNKQGKILTVYSKLHYAGYVEGGNINYMQHKNKVSNALKAMGLKPSTRRYY